MELIIKGDRWEIVGFLREIGDLITPPSPPPIARVARPAPRVEVDRPAPSDSETEARKILDIMPMMQEGLRLFHSLKDEMSKEIKPLLEKTLDPIRDAYKPIMEELDVKVSDILSRLQEEYGFDEETAKTLATVCLLAIYMDTERDVLLPPSLRNNEDNED